MMILLAYKHISNSPVVPCTLVLIGFVRAPYIIHAMVARAIRSQYNASITN
jgi:hypothetical protein